MMEEIKRQNIINQIMAENEDIIEDSMGREFLETLSLEELENLQELDAQ